MIRAADAVTLGYLGSVAFLVILFQERVEHAWIYPVMHGVVAACILALGWQANRMPRGPWILIRHWYHVVTIPLAFRELHYLVHPINPRDLDPLLTKWDWVLCGGVHPTVWLEQWLHPWLTEYLQVVYSTFYFLPAILGILLWLNRDYRGFEATLAGIVAAFYVSYLAYFAFPALGPRFELASLQHKALEGIWLTPWLRASLDRLELIQRDAFPSGHVGVSLLVVYYARQYLPRAFIPYLIVVLSLVVSTVYLRYHYVVDVISGVILAFVGIWLAHILRSRLSRLPTDP
jgi:membrane-associated phospholipid phosphatase